MKKYRILITLAVLFASISISGQTFDPNFYIFVGIGQSNMQGKGQIESKDTGNTSSFLAKHWDRYKKMIVVNNDPAKIGTWTTAKPPIVRPDTGLGVTDYFGRYLVKQLDEKHTIGVLVVAVDGTAITSFSKDKTVAQNYINDAGTGQWVKDAAAQYGNYPYGKLVEMAKIAQKWGVIKGIIYHQGETDASASYWHNSLYELYNNLLTDLNLSVDSVPLILGEPVQKDMGGSCYGQIPYIDNAPAYLKERFGSTHEVAYVVSSKDCTGSSDTFHFTSDGYRTMGTRYGEIMLPLLISQGATGVTFIEDSKEQDVIYDLLGRRLDAPKPGLNIINGKKVFIRE